MPLRKNGTTATVPATAPAATTTAPTPSQVAAAPPAKRTLGTKKAAGGPATKDEYWLRREERDIEKDHRISRQGMFQAALQSVGVLQLNTNNTLDSYMELVEKVAEWGLQFANRQ